MIFLSFSHIESSAKHCHSVLEISFIFCDQSVTGWIPGHRSQW